MGNAKRICIDTETTGTDPARDELLQVAVADFDGRELYRSYIRPVRAKEWPEAAAVNGITPDMVAGCPTAAEAREAVQAVVDGAEEVVGYNVGFDMGFLEAAGVDFSRVAVTDTMLEFAPIYGEYDEWHDDYRWQRLETAAAYVGYEHRDAHDAMGDVLATIAVQRWIEERA